MPRNVLFNTVSRRAPLIVVVTLCAALVGYWEDAPLWLPYGLAIIVGSLALFLMAARDRRALTAEEQLGSANDRSWIAHELAGNGSPAGTYLLVFFSITTVMLTSLVGAYAMPAWAALALSLAWGIANARYPTDEVLEP